MGEHRVAINLAWRLRPSTYRSFNNVIVPTSNGTTQIDHVVVSPFGVFIIETKNRAGWIFGTETSAAWTQVLYKRKYSFQNPLRQAFRQAKSLSEVLQLPMASIHSVIAFVGNSTFKTQMPPNVLHGRPSKYIRGFTAPVLSAEEQQRITDRIAEFKADRRLTDRRHIQSLRERLESRTKCPRCGSQLVERTARKGPSSGEKFLGCARFPRCRFARDA